MTLKPVACFGVADNTTFEISPENLRSILGQIEAELLCSDTYSRALASLRTMLGEATATAEILIKAVSREAIRLAFKRLPNSAPPEETTVDIDAAPASGQERLSPSYHPRLQDRPAPPPPPPPLPVSILYQRQFTHNDAVSATATLDGNNLGGSSQPGGEPPKDEFKATRSPSPSTVLRPEAVAVESPFAEIKKRKRLSKAEKAALAIQEREEGLRQLGLELRKARQVRSLSLQQLHSQTLVPLHHLEALETGQIDRLPEDIYIRGFIRRVGDALGLDGAAMVASLPTPDVAKAMLPSWSLPEVESGTGFCLRPVHLYLGYTALMAGAVGGLAWLSQQPIPGANAMPEQQSPKPPAPTKVAPEKPTTKSTPAKKQQRPVAKPGVKQSNLGGIIVGTDIAPPEVFLT